MFSRNQDDLSFRTIFPGSTKLGKARQTVSLLQNFKKDRRLTVCSSIAAASTQWGKPSNLWTPCVYSHWPRVLSWIRIRWIQYALHRNNSKSPSTLAMPTATQNIAPTSSHFIPGQHFLETFTLLSPNDQGHAFMGDYIIPVLNQQTLPLLHLWQPYATHIQQYLNLTIQISLKHLAAKMPSQLYNNFLPSFLPSYETCSNNVNPLSHAAIKN